jgi:hexosaminidase
MTLSFDARIAGREILCRIGTDRPLAAPVFCFSLMAAPRVVSGGILLRRTAGYAEVALPDLGPGQVHEIVLAYDDSRLRPVNRAWLPLGPYLRDAAGATHPLPPLPAGVRHGAAPAGPLHDGLRLIPRPANWRPAGGTLAASAFWAAHEALAAVSALGERTGLGGLLAPGGVTVTVATDPDLAAGGHVLTISPGGVSIRAADRAGIFHAGVTLLTLRANHAGALPCGEIEDHPRFGWRGQHLDCARHFFAMPTLLRLLDLMALLKMNRFHWHFADDEAFRLEVGCAPALWQKTAFRGEGCLVPGVFGGGIRSGGSYSRADVATLLARADDLGIGVMPEIEIPAHAFALNAAVPGLRDPADNGAEVSIQGYPVNVINPAMPATWDLVLPLAEEVAGMFPLGILHLGCDELPPDAWAGSPAARALMAREGLATRDDLQGWMMARVAAHLTARGIRSAAWEEAAKGAQGGIGNGALLFSWTGQGPGVAAARLGHDVVMCPAQHVYLDMAHSADPDDWGAAWAAFIDLEKVLDWSPVPAGAEDIAPRVAGVQGTFWGEFTTGDRQMEALIAPRILGVAEKAWESGPPMTGPELRAIARSYGPVFDAMGWDWHRGA